MSDKPTHKMVDGVRIELTPEEIAQIEADWAANDAALEQLEPEQKNAKRRAKRE